MKRSRRGSLANSFDHCNQLLNYSKSERRKDTTMCARKLSWVIATTVVMFVCWYSCLAQEAQQAQQTRQTAAPNLRLSNTSTKIDKKQYKWTLYIDADKSVLDRISYVEYLLHPAFDAPDRKIYSPRVGPRAFAVSDVAFRPAEITTVIHFRDGSKQYIDYTLRLRSSFANTWYVVVGYFGANQWEQAQYLAKAYQQK